MSNDLELFREAIAMVRDLNEHMTIIESLMAGIEDLNMDEDFDKLYEIPEESE